jgi:type VI secretion system protein ImpL
MLRLILSALVPLAFWLLWFFDRRAAAGEDGGFFEWEELSLWMAATVTLLWACGWVAVVVVRRVKARRAAAEIERVLSEQARAHLTSTSPERQAEIEAMQREFSDAVKTLKGSRLGQSGFGALYELPWYVIIGPPGAGKTTALRASGLRFPRLSSDDAGIRGVGGTRNCDWWFTNEAVLLDTAGRYTTEDDDRDEWFAFLNALREARSRKPVDGVIVAVALDTIAGLDREGVAAEARQVRDRIDELMRRLDMILPVYLMFTKCDLVDGFTDIFGTLKKEERKKGWGFTLPLLPQGEESNPGGVFRSHFDEMLNRVEAYSLSRMWGERRLEAREGIHAFPQQLASLREPLAQFSADIFSDTIYRETPIMRGVYFTSGTQTGRPIDRVMQSMSAAFGVDSRVGPRDLPKQAKSYFLHDVFSQVIFPDRALAVRSGAELKRQRRRRFAIVGGSAGVAVLGGWASWSAYDSATSFIDEATEATDIAEDYRLTADGARPIELSKLDRIREVARHRAEFPESLIGEGSERIQLTAEEFYGQVLRADVFRRLLDRDQAALRKMLSERALSADVLSDESFDDAHARLRNYLLLTEDAAGGSKDDGIAVEAPTRHDPDAAAWVADYLTDRWTENHLDRGPRDRKNMREHLGFFLELLSKRPELQFGRDEKLIADLRALLTRAPEIELALSRLSDRCARAGVRSVTVGKIMGSMRYVSARDGGPTGQCVDDSGTQSRARPGRLGVPEARVGSLYTRKCWELVVRGELDTADGLRGEAWVLGRADDVAAISADAFRKELRSSYLDAYVGEWKRFLRALQVTSPSTDPEARGLLEELTRGGHTPYARLFKVVAYNTRLKEERGVGEEVAVEGEGAQGGLEAAGDALKGVAAQRLKAKASGVQGGREMFAVGSAAASASGNGEDEASPGEMSRSDVERHFMGFTVFGAPPEALATDPEAEPAPPPPVDLDLYEEQLAFIRDALRAQHDDPATTQDLLVRLQDARTSVRALIEAQSPPWRPRFEALLWPPIEGAARVVSADIAGGMGLRWCNDVVASHDAGLASRYPFNRNSASELAMADFIAFYQPGTGAMWTFFDEVFGSVIDRQGDLFFFSKRLGMDYGDTYQSSLIDFYAASSRLASAVFDAEGAPSLSFKMRLIPTAGVERVTFSLGADVVTTENGPQTVHEFEWDGKSPLDAEIEFESREGVGTISGGGDWGLFRLFDKGRVTAIRGDGEFEVTWSPRDRRGVKIRMAIQPEGAMNSFMPRRRGPASEVLFPVFRSPDLSPPRQIVAGGRVCPRGLEVRP